MISPRDKLDRPRSARRLVLLATGASFAAAALLIGPGGSRQSMLPAVSTVNAKESAPQAGRGWIWAWRIQPVTTNIAESLGMKEDKGAVGRRTAHGRPRREGWHPLGRCHHRTERSTGQRYPRPCQADRRLGSGWHGETHDLAEGRREDHLADAR